MNDKKKKPIQVDTEFQSLTLPLGAEEMAELEENIFDHGCRETVKVWKGLVVDGHKRIEICDKWELEYETEELEFPDRTAVMIYICDQQLKRGDLTDEFFKYLIGKRFSLRVAQETLNCSQPDMKTMGIRANKKRGMMQKYAEETGFAVPTVRKYREFSDAIDTIKQKAPEFAKMILSSELKVSHESAVEIARLPKEEIHFLQATVDKNKLRRLRYNEIHEELRWKYTTNTGSGIRKKSFDPEIRKMPKYDPDAEVSSLSLTIPSWISSIERASERTNFDKISRAASGCLKEQLSMLQSAVTKIRRCLEEG